MILVFGLCLEGHGKVLRHTNGTDAHYTGKHKMNLRSFAGNTLGHIIVIY